MPFVCKRITGAWVGRASLFAALLLATFSLASPARAQSVELSNSSFQITREVERSSGEFPFWINRQDCLDGFASTSTVELTPRLVGATTQMNVEVWVSTAGNDCTVRENRTGSTQVCYNVASESAAGEPIRTLSIPTQEVVEGALKAANQATSGTTEDCGAAIEQGITLFVMLVQGSDVRGTPATWERTTVDLVAPPAPGSLSASGGDGLLFAEWEVATEEERSDTLGYTIWCAPAGSAAPSTGFGGAGGAGSGGTSCSQSALVAGDFGPNDDLFRCGSPNGQTVREGQATAESNGTTYAVAVSARDNVGNESRLSNIACATPQDVTTFFEQYRNNGGRGGGGFCAWVPGSHSSLLWWLGACLLVLAGRRRRLVR